MKSHGERKQVKGIVQQGYQVASGQGSESPYPYGTIEKQIPFFQSFGLDLRPFFRGTLNISLAPHQWKMINPQYTFRDIQWTDLHPPETFSFSACRVFFKKVGYESWIYYPHPATKVRHFQNPSVVEIIAPPIEGISNHDAVALEYNSKEISLV